MYFTVLRLNTQKISLYFFFCMLALICLWLLDHADPISAFFKFLHSVSDGVVVVGNVEKSSNRTIQLIMLPFSNCYTNGFLLFRIIN